MDPDNFTPEMLELIRKVREMFAQRDVSSMIMNSDIHMDDNMSHTTTRGSPLRGLRARFHGILDPLSLTVIMINALFLGMQSDIYPEWPGWAACEYVFTIFFV